MPLLHGVRTALLVAGLGTAGCGGARVVEEQSYGEAAEAAFAAAERRMQRRDWEGARNAFSQVYREYPYSQFAALAEMKVADCYFEERSWELARAAYERFVQFHPTHEEVRRAAYQVAMTWVRAMPRPFVLMPPIHERDLTQARNAFAALGSYLRMYPDAEWAEEVRQARRQVEAVLVEHELTVGQWYLQRRDPLGTARRARHVLDNFPGATRTHDALFLLASALLHLGDEAQARDHLERLVREHADTEAARVAAAWLQTHGPALSQAEP
jgi:outer membrane protein assembly factor BamD